MKTIISILLFTIVQYSASQEQLIPIKGKITDSESSEVLGLVYIQTWHNNNRYLEGCSEFDGSFTVWLPAGTQKIEFSHIGYIPKEVSIDIKANNNKILSIELDPQTFFLNEVIVEGKQSLKANEIIQKVQQNLPNTMRVGPFQCDGHITASRIKDGKYVFFGEAFFDHHNSGYAPVGHAYPILRATDYRISDQDNSYSSIGSIFFPAPVQYSLYCYDHFLLPVLLNEYFNFRCTDTLFQGTQKQLVILYELNKEKFANRKVDDSKYSVYVERLQYGEMIVNAQDYSIEEISNKGNSGEALGKEIKEYVATATFTKINKTRFMSQISINEVYLEPNIEDGKNNQVMTETKISFINFNTDSLSDKELADRYHCEVFVDKRFNTNSRYFNYKVAKKDKTSTYNSDFWQDKPKPKYWSQMKSDIETMTGRCLDEQFSSNSFFLIPEKKLKSVMMKSDRKKRQELSNTYKELNKINAFK
ncbi:MAG: carboxypeptidase-like regulatory domain-containing protein [Bacteroidales bacterium]|nr:carboxypeptidase-like regulatory domain-containing protein [Bacteroidales bacterium]